ncbi:aa3-type cytochrome c oxidase subunit IV [Pelagibius sp. CAU 1746]
MSDDQLLREHQQNWKGFVRFITISTGLVILTLALMALFLL